MQLDALCALPAVTGVRHILDEHAGEVLTHPVVRHRFAQLATAGLSFDAQLNLSDQGAAPSLAALAERNPQLRIIINHAGFPPADAQGYRLWLRALRALADCENVAIKLSGWEMTRRNWHWSHMVQVTTDVLETFAPTAVMLASNYPLCRWTHPYAALWQGYARHLPAHWHRPLMLDNARHWYRLPAETGLSATHA